MRVTNETAIRFLPEFVDGAATRTTGIPLVATSAFVPRASARTSAGMGFRSAQGFQAFRDDVFANHRGVASAGRVSNRQNGSNVHGGSQDEAAKRALANVPRKTGIVRRCDVFNQPGTYSEGIGAGIFGKLGKRSPAAFETCGPASAGSETESAGEATRRGSKTFGKRQFNSRGNATRTSAGLFCYLTMKNASALESFIAHRGTAALQGAPGSLRSFLGICKVYALRFWRCGQVFAKFDFSPPLSMQRSKPEGAPFR